MIERPFVAEVPASDGSRRSIRVSTVGQTLRVRNPVVIKGEGVGVMLLRAPHVKLDCPFTLGG